jgi:hypothetical protein
MAKEVEDTFDKLKAGAKAVAKKVSDPSKDLGDEYNKDKGKERAGDYEQTDESAERDNITR